MEGQEKDVKEREVRSKKAMEENQEEGKEDQKENGVRKGRRGELGRGDG